MDEVALPDFCGRVVALDTGSDSEFPYTVLENTRFEWQGGRLFLVGQIPADAYPDGWGAGTAWGRPAWSTAIILAAMTLSVIQTYDIVERVSTAFLGLKVFFIVVAGAVLDPVAVAAPSVIRRSTESPATAFTHALVRTTG